MLKTKIFHFLSSNEDELPVFHKKKDIHDKEISDFIEYISTMGHTFVNMDSVSYGRYDPTNRIRTIIIYHENPTRTVITEKTT